MSAGGKFPIGPRFSSNQPEDPLDQGIKVPFTPSRDMPLYIKIQEVLAECRLKPNEMKLISFLSLK